MIQGQRSMLILPANNLAVTIEFFTAGLGFRLAGILKNDDGKDDFADPAGNLICFAQDNRPGPDGPGL
jgi:catechol 2,3-dioxygenase-like lactoylglutathione lyase family enzyme